MKPTTLKDLILMAEAGKQFKAFMPGRATLSEKHFSGGDWSSEAITAEWNYEEKPLIYEYETKGIDSTMPSSQAIIESVWIPKEFAGKAVTVTVREKV